MPKRKEQNDDSDSDISLINVDFEFFDPNPIDYIALKRLIIQLFQTDADIIHPHELAELIISQRLVGTTVKTDGIDGDPYAYLTVLNIAIHRDHPSIKSLIEYVLTKSQVSSDFQSILQVLLSSHHVGFVFSERLINMPPAIVPPMYRMLSDEIKWAVDDKEPYNFSHFLFISRIYRLTAEEESIQHIDTTDRPNKRPKKQFNTIRKGDGIYSFHPEDEQIKEFASHSLDYNLSDEEPHGKDDLGLDIAGRLMLVPANQLLPLIQAIEKAYPP